MVTSPVTHRPGGHAAATLTDGEPPRPAPTPRLSAAAWPAQGLADGLVRL